MAPTSKYSDSSKSFLETSDQEDIVEELSPKPLSRSSLRKRNVKSSNDKHNNSNLTDSKYKKTPPQIIPSAILDGSKLILRLVKSEIFTFDSAINLLLSNSKLKYEKAGGWQTTVTTLDEDNTVVFDANLLGHTFIPISLSHYGVVYTKNGTIHLTVGSSVKRARVFSRYLPYRTCNKFHSSMVATPTEKDDEKLLNEAKHIFNEQNKVKSQGAIDFKKAIELIKRAITNPQQGMLYIRSDSSLLRYSLAPNERIEIFSSIVVAWTAGIRFEMNSCCFFRTIVAVQGEGTVWIKNNRNATARTFPTSNSATT